MYVCAIGNKTTITVSFVGYNGGNEAGDIAAASSQQCIYIVYLYTYICITSGVDLLLSCGGHNSHLETTHRWYINPALSVYATARFWVEF